MDNITFSAYIEGQEKSIYTLIKNLFKLALSNCLKMAFCTCLWKRSLQYKNFYEDSYLAFSRKRTFKFGNFIF